jgi:quercetin dioxygenase-like cupin family protein
MKNFQHVKNQEGKNYNYAQDHCFVKVASQDTNGTLCMVEDLLKPGFYLPRHHHKIMTEIFYVLEGDVIFIFDNETIHAAPGDTITIQPNVWHTVKSAAGAKMLTIFKDGQFDLYLHRLSQMTDTDFQNAAFMQALSAEFDIYNE